MSHIVSGYGICVTNLEGETKEGFESLLKRAPEYLQEEVAEKIEDAQRDKDVGCSVPPDIEDYLDIGSLGDECNSPVAALLRSVIEKETGIRLAVVEDYGGEYLIFPATYPWRM